VTFGALTLTSLLAGRVPGTLWLMMTLAFVSVLLDSPGRFPPAAAGRAGCLDGGSFLAAAAAPGRR
jgi:hypothetical protein